MSGSKPDIDARKAKFEKLWQQLATTLKDKVTEAFDEVIANTEIAIIFY
jgi:hypothetical protein